MNGSNWFVMWVIATLAVGTVAVAPAHAKGFSNADVKGTYSFVGGSNSEWVPGTPPLKLDLATVALSYWDGKGNFKGPETDTSQCTFQDCGQSTCHGIGSGTYTVNPDGTGTASVTIVYSDQVNCGTVKATLDMAIGNFGNTLNFVAKTASLSLSGGPFLPVDSNVFSLIGTRLTK